MSALAWAGVIVGVFIGLGSLVWGTLYVVGRLIDEGSGFYHARKVRAEVAIFGLLCGFLACCVALGGNSLGDFFGGVIILLGVYLGLLSGVCFVFALSTKSKPKKRKGGVIREVQQAIESLGLEGAGDAVKSDLEGK